MSWFPGRYKGAIRSPNSLREQSENILVTLRWFCVRVCTDSCMHGSRGVYYRRCQCGDWHPAGRTHTAATTTHTHTHTTQYLEEWQAASRCTHLSETLALTSQRTAAGYGRGARVRTLVPSRILPRASPVCPNSCSWKQGSARARVS